jgi:hypothetical protein
MLNEKLEKREERPLCWKRIILILSQENRMRWAKYGI